MSDQTIFALSSGSGKAGIAIIRISGPQALATLSRLTGLKSPAPRLACRIKVRKSKTKETIDDGLALYFPAPNSFTGEDVVELHLHGSRAVLNELTPLLCEDGYVRLAEPGEFTRRAFDNGKLDLTAAEGLADLINAETAFQRKQARRQMRGELAALYDGWREDLLQAIAFFEAEIDFSDEELPKNLKYQVDKIVSELQEAVDSHLTDSARGKLVREGFYIAIIGPPNAGKSSLLNKLAQRDVAIVSEAAGTTRDVIEVHLDLCGYSVTFADTAGLRPSSFGIEAEGVSRTLDRAKNADLRLIVFDGAKWPNLDAATLDIFNEGNVIAAVNKIDLGLELGLWKETPTPILGVSANTGEGLDSLLEHLAKTVSERCQPSTGPVITRHRHEIALNECSAALLRYSKTQITELAAEDLRLASRSLGKITGQFHVEDILDVIFKEFCIGK